MQKNVVKILAKQFFKNAFSNKAFLLLMVLFAALLLYATVTGMLTYRHQTASRIHFQKEVREHWEAMPDKHPHRMAHYGYIAFRAKHPLSMFDYGTENYTGNAVFLEAHKQNSINFSEAGFSTGLLRFGEISIATILQMLIPLLLFFVGFGCIAADRENGTLKILLSQGASWKDIITGNTLGLMAIAGCFVVPAFLLLSAALLFSNVPLTAAEFSRLGLLLLTYLVYFAIISILTVLVSAFAKKAKTALIALIGIWLLFAVILPRSIQAAGSYIHPAPSRIAFETAVEKDILSLGDSHDPNDPYYKKIKDSVLKANNADSVQQLNFNYSGFQMKEGERLSASIYNQHLARLLKTYEQQNNVFRLSAFINPFAATRTVSMSLSGTDFHSYILFQEQAEAYRYKLAQHMNDLQIRLISNNKPAATDKPYSISSENWKAFPDYEYKGLNTAQAVAGEWMSLAALCTWLLLLVVIASSFSKKLKAV